MKSPTSSVSSSRKGGRLLSAGLSEELEEWPVLGDEAGPAEGCTDR